MQIELKETQMVARKIEIHYKVVINGKEVWVNKWEEFNELEIDAGIEFFQGEELLTEEEKEVVIEYIEDEKYINKD